MWDCPKVNKDKDKKNGGSPRRRGRNLKCFNCGGPHLVYECDAADFDPDRVEENRRESTDRYESRREQHKVREEPKKIGTWSIKVVPKEQSLFDKTVSSILEVATEDHYMIELDDDLEFCTITGIADEDELQKIKKDLEKALPKKVDVMNAGRVSAATLKTASDDSRSTMSKQDISRVDKLETDMKLVKTEIVGVKSLQSDMNNRMEKMHGSIEDMRTKRSDESLLLRSLAKKFLDPSEIPPTPNRVPKPSPQPKRSPGREGLGGFIPETQLSEDTDMDLEGMEDPARRLSMDSVPSTPLGQIGRKREQSSPGARLGSKGYLHLPPQSPNNDTIDWTAKEITLLSKVNDHKWWAQLLGMPKDAPPVMVELQYFYTSQESSDAALAARLHGTRPRR